MMDVKTVILCGGFGTRIRGVDDNLPKAMIPIGEYPILWHILKLYAHYGLKDFVLCLGYKSWAIKEYFLNYKSYSSDFTVRLGQDASVQFHGATAEDWSVTMAETGLSTQTGGRIWSVRRYLQESPLFCVTYGDGVADIDLTTLVNFHLAHGRIGTVTGVRPPGRFGVMDIEVQDNVQVVRQFQEKPQTSGGWINGGFFVFDQRLWSYLNDNPDLIFEHEPLRDLAKDGELVMYRHEGFWQPMDTYREWQLLNKLWAADQAPWKR